MEKFLWNILCIPGTIFSVPLFPKNGTTESSVYAAFHPPVFRYHFLKKIWYRENPVFIRAERYRYHSTTFSLKILLHQNILYTF